jgi:hypothetical protein
MEKKKHPVWGHAQQGGEAHRLSHQWSERSIFPRLQPDTQLFEQVPARLGIHHDDPEA